MTEVYESVLTTNDVEDKYAKNESARKALLGPLSIVIKCLGFDETYSLFNKETRSRCISWISTPLCIVGILVLIANFFPRINNLSEPLSWHWGEEMILAFLAAQSLAAAIFIMSRTRSLFFLSYYEAWKECDRLGEIKEEKEEKKENGDAEIGRPSFSIPRSTSGRFILVFLCFFFFIASTITSSYKYAHHHGFSAHPKENTTSLLLDHLFTLEPLTSLWAALLSATAFSIYGVLHGILEDTIDDFNKDLKAASDSKTLSSRFNSFIIRHQSVLVFARLLSSKMGTFATFGTKTSIVANFLAMFLSLAYKGDISGLSNACVLLWTVIAIAPMVVLLLQPATVQNKLNETCEILVADKDIWTGDVIVAQRAQMMLQKIKFTDTTVSLFKCLKLTPWVANGVMLVPPFIGGSLICLRLYYKQ